ncbi:MAG: flagellin [Solirubrobacterales bacterium]
MNRTNGSASKRTADQNRTDASLAAQIVLSADSYSVPEGGVSPLRGAQEAISFARATEDNLSAAQSILKLLREIGVKAPSLSPDARRSIQVQISDLQTKLDQIADTAVENHRELLGVTPTAAPVPDTRRLGIQELRFTDDTSASKGVTLIDQALEMIERQKISMTDLQHRMKKTIDTLTVSNENLSASQLNIENTEKAKEMLAYVKSSLAAGPRELSRFHMPVNIKVIDLINE